MFDLVLDENIDLSTRKWILMILAFPESSRRSDSGLIFKIDFGGNCFLR
jgi:hypothetical protein